MLSLWYERERRGRLPRAGGWLDQPLALLMQLDTLDLVIRAGRITGDAEEDWSNLTKLQADLVRWLDNDG